ncbi:MAG: aminotransferase class I/II-fold pyridoxal phosphate-dependent enzyme, partial [Actinomycetia bacterium]|nr:aminotransferase class I/II-fold pyridoxal phosphate-dependent enzyme [Actinomycetes bacterium]
FSKTYAMTGWRLGYLIAPKSFTRPLQKLQQNFFICPNAFVQWAGITALKKTGKEIKKMRETYNKRRIFLLDKLKKLGFQVNSEPNGAFYILANAKMFSNNSYEFALEILENANVAVAPGIDFGSNAEGFIRFSYANSLDNIKIGCERLKIFLKNRERRGNK